MIHHFFFELDNWHQKIRMHNNNKKTITQNLYFNNKKMGKTNTINGEKNAQITAVATIKTIPWRSRNREVAHVTHFRLVVFWRHKSIRQRLISSDSMRCNKTTLLNASNVKKGEWETETKQKNSERQLNESIGIQISPYALNMMIYIQFVVADNFRRLYCCVEVERKTRMCRPKSIRMTFNAIDVSIFLSRGHNRL